MKKTKSELADKIHDAIYKSVKDKPIDLEFVIKFTDNLATMLYDDFSGDAEPEKPEPTKEEDKPYFHPRKWSYPSENNISINPEESIRFLLKTRFPDYELFMTEYEDKFRMVIMDFEKQLPLYHHTLLKGNTDGEHMNVVINSWFKFIIEDLVSKGIKYCNQEASKELALSDTDVPRPETTGKTERTLGSEFQRMSEMAQAHRDNEKGRLVFLLSKALDIGNRTGGLSSHDNILSNNTIKEIVEILVK